MEPQLETNKQKKNQQAEVSSHNTPILFWKQRVMKK